MQQNASQQIQKSWNLLQIIPLKSLFILLFILRLITIRYFQNKRILPPFWKKNNKNLTTVYSHLTVQAEDN